MGLRTLELEKYVDTGGVLVGRDGGLTVRSAKKAKGKDHEDFSREA